MPSNFLLNRRGECFIQVRFVLRQQQGHRAFVNVNNVDGGKTCALRVLSGGFHGRINLGALYHAIPLAASHVFSYPKAMEVHFTPEQQAQIAQVATKAGTVPERLVTNVVVRYLNEETRFLAAVEKGLAAAERGEFIEEEEMDARLEAMFKT